ncbi:3'-5' exonuclease [Clostridium sp. HBUAS56017]|uniref:3'-5' exonuclease n=1 Tax=Clostridium sp. HBUAS56017 TaxID=2571128 RepID=UPI0011786D5E|nr:3'-5' exonuclease [Clostridium sp. HBUAS56017]
MEEELKKLEKECSKYDQISGIAFIIALISFIIMFYHIIFLFIVIISIISFASNFRKMKLVMKEIKTIKAKLGLNEQITNESNELLCENEIIESKIKKDINEFDADLYNNSVNKKRITTEELYLNKFEALEKYNIDKELDKDFLKKIRRSNHEVDYEKFIKLPGTTKRPYDFIVFDLETTGLKYDSSEIIEIGAIKFINGAPVETFNTYIKPKRKITKKITSINGISNDMVEDAPSIEDVIPRFVNFIEDYVLIAHNSEFDVSFIMHQIYKMGIKKIKNRVIDTLKLARQKVREYDFETDRNSKLNSYKLESLKDYFGLWKVGSHNALDDCKVCAYVYLMIIGEYGDICYV